MEGAHFVGSGEVAGMLLSVSGFPAWVSDSQAGWVSGDVFEVSAEVLNKLDQEEAHVATSVAGGGYQLVRAKVYRPGSQIPPWVAWAWEWTGNVEKRQIIPSGDWMDAQHPRTAPWLTGVAVACLISLPAGLITGVALHASSDAIVRGLGDMVALASAIGPMAAAVSAYFGDKRREKFPAFRALLFVAGATFSCLALLALIAAGINRFL